jgi:alkanesulfonate monooxygenase
VNLDGRAPGGIAMTRFGLAIRNFVGPGEVPDVQALYAYAERAEALGFESLWAWDHVILGVEPAFPILDAITILGAVAARTRTINLGTGVLVLPLRNPVLAAKALGSLDVISGGRLILGVAAGWYAREFDAVGAPFKQRGRQFERNLDILMRLWTQDRVTLAVDEFNLREAVMVPRPAQRPRPPILIGGYVDAVLRRAGTVGDGWLTYFYTPESFSRGWEKVRAFAREAGRDPATLTATNQLAISVGRSREETAADMRHWLQTEWDVASWSESTIEHAIHGSAAECVEQLRAHVATGVDRIILIPYRYQPEQVERIATEVLSRL